MSKKILITGASGFIGSFIVEQALENGFEVWAAVRRTSSKAYLTDQRIHFIELNLNDAARLQQQLQAHFREQPKWDFIVHAAGATKGKNEDAFLQNNLCTTQNFVESLRACGALPERMVFMSSLSVLGALRQEPDAQDGHVYAAMRALDEPRPNTAYGRSKLATEKYLLSQSDLDCVLLRPTGVYGPREKDYFLMAQSIVKHIDFGVGFRPQEITFVYVKDLVQAVFLALAKGEKGCAYFVTDGSTYKSDDFSKLIQENLGVRHVLHIQAPLFVLKAICSLGALWARMTGKMSALNPDKYNILKQRNWRCDISAIQTLGYVPQYDLRRGVEETIAWYKQQKWI